MPEENKTPISRLVIIAISPGGPGFVALAFYCFFWVDKSTAYRLFCQTVFHSHMACTLSPSSQKVAVSIPRAERCCVHFACSPFVSAALCLSGVFGLPPQSNNMHVGLLATVNCTRMVVLSWTCGLELKWHFVQTGVASAPRQLKEAPLAS